MCVCVCVTTPTATAFPLQAKGPTRHSSSRLAALKVRRTIGSSGPSRAFNALLGMVSRLSQVPLKPSRTVSALLDVVSRSVKEAGSSVDFCPENDAVGQPISCIKSSTLE